MYKVYWRGSLGVSEDEARAKWMPRRAKPSIVLTGIDLIQSHSLHQICIVGQSPDREVARHGDGRFISDGVDIGRLRFTPLASHRYERQS